MNLERLGIRTRTADPDPTRHQKLENDTDPELDSAYGVGTRRNADRGFTTPPVLSCNGTDPGALCSRSSQRPPSCPMRGPGGQPGPDDPVRRRRAGVLVPLLGGGGGPAQRLAGLPGRPRGRGIPSRTPPREGEGRHRPLARRDPHAEHHRAHARRRRRRCRGGRLLRRPLRRRRDGRADAPHPLPVRDRAEDPWRRVLATAVVPDGVVRSDPGWILFPSSGHRSALRD